MVLLEGRLDDGLPALNTGDIHGRTTKTAGQRMVKSCGGIHSWGGWETASGMTAEQAGKLVAELEAANYQVIRPPFDVGKGGKFEVKFR